MDARAKEIERLYHARYTNYRHAVAAIVGDYDAAHDAVQDGFARAFAERTQFAGGSLEAWVWRIVFRKALDARRRDRRNLPLDEAFDPAIIQAEHDPELVAALRALPPRRRLLVFLRYFADLSYEDIAEVCELSVGTVSATLSQGLDALRTELGLTEVDS
jgi:RNA polymerase sigma factor (sigma-70 family)